jgi:hypothetical protein
MKMQEVRAMAKKLGVGSFGKSKADLIREIQRVEGNFDCYGSADAYCDQLACTFRSSCFEEDKAQSKSRKVTHEPR